ncbi:MAG: beta-glucoside-specific PTS transporter subunit IIABC [Eubacterium sp.]|nr:beta-glucoside-specific PTS transporter subunit IIABC [Eubacterium sp.]
MGKYENLAKEIVGNIGGKENVISLTHCVTRLRFVLKDESKAQDDALKKMDGVVTVMKSGGQYQVVIGSHVPEVYADVCPLLGIESREQSDTAQEEKPKGSLGDRFIDTVSGIFQPILGVLSACGMLKGLNSLFSFMGLYAESSGTYQYLNAFSDALFMFLPVLLAFTASKKFKLKPFVGMTIGCALCYPAIQLSALSGAAEPLYTLFGGTAFESPVYQTLFGIPVIAMDYTSTVIPVILIIYFASRVQKMMEKIIPEIVAFFFVPMFTLVISLAAGFILIGPAATFGSNLILQGILLVRGLSPLVAGALVGGLWQVLVMFGLHWGFIPVYINNIMTIGYDNIMMPFFGATWATTGVVLAIMIKTKDKKLKSLCVPSAISGFFGVTEPAIYGITLPRKKPFVISCIASAIVGAFYGIIDLKEYIFGGLGIFEFPAMIDPATGDLNNVTMAVIGAAAATALGFVLTFLFCKTDEEEGEQQKEKSSSEEKGSTVKREILASPLSGKVIPLLEVTDAAFSSGVLGKGVAILPDKGEVKAPADGTIQAIFPTKHAIGMVTENGVELLIHIGMNTVQLEGEGFTSRISEGMKVKKGDVLVTFDKALIEGKGYSLETPVLITNADDIVEIVETENTFVESGDVLLTAIF